MDQLYDVPFFAMDDFNYLGWSTFLAKFEQYRARGGQATLPLL